MRYSTDVTPVSARPSPEIRRLAHCIAKLAVINSAWVRQGTVGMVYASNGTVLVSVMDTPVRQ
jgi:hypothetical protein